MESEKHLVEQKDSWFKVEIERAGKNRMFRDLAKSCIYLCHL